VVRNTGHPSTEGFFRFVPPVLSHQRNLRKAGPAQPEAPCPDSIQRDIIRGRRVLDIASHDGRLSFGANNAAAEYVLGIEAQQRLMENARDNMREYGVPRARLSSCKTMC
jgi:ribosomal protein L11 methylase PrmA